MRSLALLLALIPCHAAVLLETPVSTFVQNFPANNGTLIGYAVPITVGASSVTMDQFGFFGRATSTVDINFFIMDPTLQPGALPDYDTPGVLAETSPSWHLSPVISGGYVLQANTTYILGFAIQGGGLGVNFRSQTPAFTQNGLTQEATSNQILGSYSSPTLGGTTTTQFLVQIIGPGTSSSAVPEPATWGLLCVGGAVCYFRRRS
jgi:hypothetical protein